MKNDYPATDSDTCLACYGGKLTKVLELAPMPPANALMSTAAEATALECFPLGMSICDRCFFAQVFKRLGPEQHFHSQYSYFSSYSATWRNHCADYAKTICANSYLDADDLVLEIASNDGCLLEGFLKRGYRVLGVEPSSNTSAMARDRGIESLEIFFGEKNAALIVESYGRAKLVVANNVLAHVPKIIDFLRGVKQVLAEDGLVTFEFPHLLSLLENCQFDTVYHEHYSYLSMVSVTKLLRDVGLIPFRVENLSTHGGSLRVYACHSGSALRMGADISLDKVEKAENECGLDLIETYLKFASRVESIKSEFIRFVHKEKSDGKTIIGYGAAAKGITFLNSTKTNSTQIDYIVDLSPFKQGKFIPGSGIPVYPEEMIRRSKPDYVIILPWNIRDEIVEQLCYIREWGGKFIVALPEMRVI